MLSGGKGTPTLRIEIGFTEDVLPSELERLRQRVSELEEQVEYEKDLLASYLRSRWRF